MLTFILLIVVDGNGSRRNQRQGKIRAAVLSAMRRFQTLWARADLRYHCKVVIGLYQCAAAVPSCFDVRIPPSMRHYSKWITVLEIPAALGVETVFPSACFGSYKSRLVIDSIWPIIFLLIVAAGLIVRELARDQYLGLSRRRAKRAAIHAGLQRTLPSFLLVTFLLVPSTATRIFKTFLCEPFELNEAAGTTVRYMTEDLSTTCSSDEYRMTYNIATVLIFVWPVGCGFSEGPPVMLVCFCTLCAVLQPH